MNDIDRRAIRLIRGGQVRDSKDARILRAMQIADFDEGKHPRSPDGKFTSGGGSQPKQAPQTKPRKTFSLAELMPKKTEREIKPTTNPKNFYGEHTLKGTAQELNKWGNERSAAWKQFMFNPTRKNWHTVQKQYIDNPVDADPVQDEDPTEDGGPGSGNFGHKGRPGKQGGSGKGGSESASSKNVASEATFSEPEYATMGPQPIAKEGGNGYNNAKFNPDNYKRNQDGTVVVTDRLTASGHKGTSVPRQLRPFAVLQNIGGANRQTNRTFYDENGFICLQIHSRCHGNHNKYKDPDGFHAHDYIDGIRVRNAGNVNPDGRECTEQQKRMCGDLR